MNDTQRKWKKQISKDSWMLKLQRLCFGGATPKFVGYCPFFWFTWFCLLFGIILILARLLISSFVGAISAINTLKSRRPYRPTDKELLAFYDHFLANGQNLNWEREHNSLVWPAVFRWIDKTPDWENCAKQALIRRESRLNADKEREARNAERAKKISGLTVWIGRVIKPLLVVAGILASYKIGRVVFNSLLQITWQELLTAGKWAIIIFALVSSIILAFNSVKFVVIWTHRCPKVPGRISWWSKPFRAAWKPFPSAAEFLFDTIETVYTRECPLIEWGDETQPITRNGE